MKSTFPESKGPAQRASLAQWLTYLESIHPSTIDLGLDRVQQVAENLALDFSNTTVITVAGTNGKGTTCRFLEQALLCQGKSTGVYASPHLLNYCERVRLNGNEAADDVFCDAFERIEQARGEVSLTYFEFGTLAAMLMMTDANVDYAILEVGLGGRLDATNIVAADIAVITTIGLDHMDWLGDSRDEIAIEKAGIMRPQGLAVVGDLDPPATLIDYVAKQNIDAWWAKEDFTFRLTADNEWEWQKPSSAGYRFSMPQIPVQNVSTALAVLSRLDLLPSLDKLQALIKTVSVPGRRQKIASQPDVFVDVAHNPQACALMRQWIGEDLQGRLHIVVGMLVDKSLSATLDELGCIEATWYIGSTSGPRCLSGKVLKQHLQPKQQQCAQTYDSVTDAYLAARESAQTQDRILVFGSFLTVADVLAYHRDSSIQ
ncbi:bifunctional tetrahydrofolate synthase/dihydrofolate synthase [Alteromonas sp. 14N.309.X.WAT.G.H12]|uniref:bifunctional tetrahydrofolate synthase/dihydrofolate synthase n=1 Tax=Alteromonas sp. 14N.309.X.WAT.G.H12 TaxID=3120824 RepID=UPI002FD69743